MPPSPQNVAEEGIFDPSNNRLEVLYHGYYYDITDFIKKHPGGSVIKFYTEKGEDATQAIEQFHHRSINKINLMLKSFKKRPAEDKEYLMSPERLKRHRALTEDYTKLFLEAQKEGLFEPSYSHFLRRLCQFIAVLCVGFACQSSLSIWTRLTGAVLIGFACSENAQWMHEGGHNSLTGNPKWDKLLQSIVLGVLNGASARWWNAMHNRHHAMPQRLHHDVDLETTPFIAFHAKVVKDSKQGNNFFIQNQRWLFLSVDLLLVTISWAFVLGPRNAIKNRSYFDLLMTCGHYFLIWYFMSPATLLLAYWVVGIRLFGNFALNHSWMPVTEENTNWVEYSLVHTADLPDHWLVSWWMGYLNYQVEHHLFPTMPQFKNRLIKDRVKALAQKHGLPYHEYGYFEAWGKMLRNLGQVSRELKKA